MHCLSVCPSSIEDLFHWCSDYLSMLWLGLALQIKLPLTPPPPTDWVLTSMPRDPQLMSSQAEAEARVGEVPDKKAANIEKTEQNNKKHALLFTKTLY